MKYFLAITLLAIILFNPAFAQSKNPSLILYNEEVPYYDFNRVARDTIIMELRDIHEISWQVILKNDLMYASSSVSPFSPLSAASSSFVNSIS